MKTFIILFTLALSTFAIAAKPKEILKIEVYQKPQVSPDGKYFAVLQQGADGRTRLLIRDLTKHSIARVAPVNPAQGQWGEKSVENFAWVNNENIVFIGGWDEGVKSLHTVSVKGLKTNVESVNESLINNLNEDATNAIVDPIPGSTQFIVSRSYPKSPKAKSSVLRLDLNKRNTEEELYSAESKSIQAFCDRQHTLRLIKREDPSGEGSAWFGLPEGTDAWKKLTLNQWYSVFGFDLNTDRILAGGSFAGKPSGIYYYSLSEDKALQRLLVDDTLPLDKFATPLFMPNTGRLVGAHIDGTVKETKWVDAAITKVQQNINHACQGSINRIVSWDDRLSRVVVERSYSSKPATFHAFDFSKGVMDLLYTNGGKMKDNETATTRGIKFQNREGDTIEGFLTQSKKSKKNAPLVVIVRDNPFATIDRHGWKSDDQYFATLGYAVLRLNFRGSGGLRGPLALNWNQKDAALKPIHDIEDALKWIEAQGHADPSNAGIIGYGAGGWIATYATIAAPNLFKCAISNGTVYDLIEYQNREVDQPISSGGPHIFAEPGYGLSRETLASLSPLQNASKITAALLVGYGEWNSEGYNNHVKEFAKVAKAAGVTIEAPYKGGWWGGAITSNNEFYEFNQKIAAFLKKHL